MFAADLNVDITNDQIGEDETPQPGSTGPHVIPDHKDDALGAGKKRQHHRQEWKGTYESRRARLQ